MPVLRRSTCTCLWQPLRMRDVGGGIYTARIHNLHARGGPTSVLQPAGGGRVPPRAVHHNVGTHLLAAGQAHAYIMGVL